MIVPVWSWHHYLLLFWCFVTVYQIHLLALYSMSTSNLCLLFLVTVHSGHFFTVLDLNSTVNVFTRDVIYTSRTYATMSVSVCLCRKCIGTLQLIQVTNSDPTLPRFAATVLFAVFLRADHLAPCQPVLGSLVILYWHSTAERYGCF